MMKFQNAYHEGLYHALMAKMRVDDCYHRSAAYLMALADLAPIDVFDFKEDRIRHEGLYAVWQTSSTRKATRLMFNLWNGCYQDAEADAPEETTGYYVVDEIFSNYEYAPYFWEAIKIRFEWV